MATKQKMIKKIDNLTQEWSITIDKADIENSIGDELRKIQAKVHIDGYRKGHVPENVLRKHYGDDALRRACTAEIGKAVDKIVADENFDLAFRPEVTIKDQFEFDKDISVNVKFIVKPKMPKKFDFDKISIDAYQLELTDEDKQEEVERFRAKTATSELAEEGHVVANTDLVDIDFVGKTLDGVEFDGGSAKGYKLEIGSKAFINGFEEQIIGHKKGDTFDIKVKFPDVYHVSDLAGKDAIFTITINDVFVKKLPELTDAYAKQLGFDNIEAVRNLLFQNLKNIYESQMKVYQKDRLFDAVIEKNKFELSDTFIDKETDARLQEAKEQFEQANANAKDDKNKEKFDEKATRAKIETNLRKSYSTFYLIDHLAKVNDIKVSEEEINQTITQDAIRGGFDINKAISDVKKDEKLYNYVAFSVQEAKVFELVYSNVNKNIKKLDRKAFEKCLDEERKKMEAGR